MLEKAIEANVKNLHNDTVNVSYFLNVIITKQDKVDIFGVILMRALDEADIADYLNATTELIFLNDCVEFKVPMLSGVPLSLMNQNELQRKANQQGRIKYLIIQPLLVKGKRILATVKLWDQFRYNTINVPLRITLSFICIREHGRWEVEKAIVHSA